MSEKVILELEQLIDGLWWSSESDYDWEVKTFEDLEVMDEKKLEVVDFDKFFASVTKFKSWYEEEERQQVKQYQDLVEYLKSNLTDLKVYRIGEVEVDIYVMGYCESSLIALKTTSIET